MTEHKHADDGGPYHAMDITLDNGEHHYAHGVSIRTRLAMEFAAAWLPLVTNTTQHADLAGSTANELGLAMADDLIMRLRENA